MDVVSQMTSVLESHPDVRRVALVGSRARSEATALSDWDFRIDTANAATLAHELPGLVAPLETLAAQWDRLTARATYMLVLPGPIKVDLFPGDERREIEPPWEPTQVNLAAVDAHFWDWVLWLGGKALGKRTEIVDEELLKLYGHILGPLRVATPPTTIDAAVSEYCTARDTREREWVISIPRRLGDEVLSALRRHRVIGRA